MAEVFKDFLVVIEDAEGQRRGSLTPEQFREAVGCSRTAFLADCIDRYNARQAREGAEDRARLEMRTEGPRRARRRWR
jgi:hypothetical protein